MDCALNKCQHLSRLTVIYSSTPQFQEFTLFPFFSLLKKDFCALLCEKAFLLLLLRIRISSSERFPELELPESKGVNI